MSIVEKAILRSKAEAAKALAPAAPAAQPEAKGAQLPPLEVAEAPAVAIRDKLAFDRYPEVARDFRFLKRPVLARVFGLSRSGVKPGNRVMITSDLPQAGKSFVALNLAASMASERMMRVLLLDADPVRHTLSSELGVGDRPGLLELLAGEVKRVGEVMLATDIDSLYFLPAGQYRPDATELLASARMPDILQGLADPNVVVLLDAPPLLLSSEGRVIADRVQHALVVVEAGRSTAGEIDQVLDLLRASAASINVVLNKTPAPAAVRHQDYYNAY